LIKAERVDYEKISERKVCFSQNESTEIIYCEIPAANCPYADINIPVSFGRPQIINLPKPFL
jgi:hypothetical protein